MLPPVIKSSVIVGGTTMLSALMLEQIYDKVGFHPPNVVLWFLSGALAYASIEAVEHLINQEILETGHQITG